MAGATIGTWYSRGRQLGTAGGALRGSAGLQSARNVRGLEKHGGNRGGRFGSVGNPIAPGLDPQAAGNGKAGIGARGRQSRTGRTFDLRLGICQRPIQRPDRRVAGKSFIMTAKSTDLLYGFVSVANQRRPPVLCRGIRCASIRSIAVRSASCTTDAGTTRPAAISASLRARAASSSASLGMGGSQSAGCLRCGVSSMRERIGGLGGVGNVCHPAFRHCEGSCRSFNTCQPLPHLAPEDTPPPQESS